jgi:hypothetical protein
MNDALRVRAIHAASNFNGQRYRRFVLQRFAGNEMFQRYAVEKLHGNEGLLVVFPNFIDGADIRMIQRGRRARFTPETFQRLRVF